MGKNFVTANLKQDQIRLICVFQINFRHYHSMGTFVKYSLLSVSRTNIVAASHKASFCLEDTECRAGTTQKYHCLKEQAIRTRLKFSIWFYFYFCSVLWTVLGLFKGHHLFWKMPIVTKNLYIKIKCKVGHFIRFLMGLNVLMFYCFQYFSNPDPNC